MPVTAESITVMLGWTILNNANMRENRDEIDALYGIIYSI